VFGVIVGLNQFGFERVDSEGEVVVGRAQVTDLLLASVQLVLKHGHVSSASGASHRTLQSSSSRETDSKEPTTHGVLFEFVAQGVPHRGQLGQQASILSLKRLLLPSRPP
jgi:hypothetical protein